MDSSDDPLEKLQIEGASAPKKGKKRPHPYAHEVSTPEENRTDPAKITLFWAAIALVLVVGGLALSRRFSPHVTGAGIETWEAYTLAPLFAGLILLGFGFLRTWWAKRLTMSGWVLFASYWSLTALDLFYKEGRDYVNFVFALVGTVFFVYMAYHQWLSLARNVHNDAVHFINVASFFTAGTYFVIREVQTIRVGLITMVGHHTKWMLGLFGQGKEQNLQFVIDKNDPWGPVTFFYPDKFCDPTRYDDAGNNDPVGQYCAQLPQEQQNVITYPDAPTNWFQELLQWTPEGENLLILPVSIILACTAVQSIMLFVGLFAGTRATWQKKLQMSLIVGAIIYVLNLVRNTGIIWFYGQGYASFWVMHNAIGKGGSLLAMIGIAFGIFKFFPEFFKSLVGVLDLPDRDGPVERTLRIGRRRPSHSAALSDGNFAGEIDDEE